MTRENKPRPINLTIIRTTAQARALALELAQNGGGDESRIGSRGDGYDEPRESFCGWCDDTDPYCTDCIADFINDAGWCDDAQDTLMGMGFAVSQRIDGGEVEVAA